MAKDGKRWQKMAKDGKRLKGYWQILARLLAIDINCFDFSRPEGPGAQTCDRLGTAATTGQPGIGQTIPKLFPCRAVDRRCVGNCSVAV